MELIIKENRMYILTVVLLMVVLPIASIFMEIFLFKSTSGVIALIGRWFVFWAMGVRLFSAGLRQIVNPRFTAEGILGIKAEDALHVVQELGYANLCMGVLGIITLLNNSWVMPAAISGCLFYAFAGIRHLMKKEKNFLEKVATASDLFIGLVLLVFIIGSF
jgi:hypothetical protein